MQFTVLNRVRLDGLMAAINKRYRVIEQLTPKRNDTCTSHRVIRGAFFRTVRLWNSIGSL